MSKKQRLLKRVLNLEKMFEDYVPINVANGLTKTRNTKFIVYNDSLYTYNDKTKQYEIFIDTTKNDYFVVKPKKISKEAEIIIKEPEIIVEKEIETIIEKVEEIITEKEDEIITENLIYNIEYKNNYNIDESQNINDNISTKSRSRKSKFDRTDTEPGS